MFEHLNSIDTKSWSLIKLTPHKRQYLDTRKPKVAISVVYRKPYHKIPRPFL